MLCCPTKGTHMVWIISTNKSTVLEGELTHGKRIHKFWFVKWIHYFSRLVHQTPSWIRRKLEKDIFKTFLAMFSIRSEWKLPKLKKGSKLIFIEVRDLHRFLCENLLMNNFQTRLTGASWENDHPHFLES